MARISTTPAHPPAPGGFRSKCRLVVVDISRSRNKAVHFRPMPPLVPPPKHLMEHLAYTAKFGSGAAKQLAINSPPAKKTKRSHDQRSQCLIRGREVSISTLPAHHRARIPGIWPKLWWISVSTGTPTTKNRAFGPAFGESWEFQTKRISTKVPASCQESLPDDGPERWI